MVLVVILGRTGRTEFNLPATLAALAANIALNLLLVPPLGIVGAGLALVASYIVVLALMYVFTQRLFPVPYQWGRLARVVLTAAVLVGAGELLLPTSGAAGLLGRVVLFAAYPLVLFASGFFTPGERVWLARLRHPAELVASFQRLRAEPSAVDGRIPETYEVERMDEDPPTALSRTASVVYRVLCSSRGRRTAALGRGSTRHGWGRAPGGRGPGRSPRVGWG